MSSIAVRLTGQVTASNAAVEAACWRAAVRANDQQLHPIEVRRIDHGALRLDLDSDLARPDGTNTRSWTGRVRITETLGEATRVAVYLVALWGHAKQRQLAAQQRYVRLLDAVEVELGALDPNAELVRT